MFTGINEVDQVSVDNSFDNVLSSSVSAETSPGIITINTLRVIIL